MGRLNRYKNRNQWGEDYYEHDELLFSDYVSLDEWVLAYYYGTSSELTIPSDTHYLSLKEVPATTILKLSTINKQNLSYIGDSVKRTIKIDGYDDYDFGFSAEGAWAEFTSGYSSVGFYLKAYNGSNKTLVIDNNFPVYNIEKTAIPSDVMVYSTFYYSHPDIFDSLDMHVQGLNDYIFRYSRDEGRLYIYSYPAVMNGTIRLDSQIIQRNVGIGNIPTSIKIIYPIDEISTMYGREFLRENFTDRNFYLPDYPEFSLRFLYSTNYYYEDKIILYRYTGSAKEVTLDCYYINSIDENAFPDDVKIYNLIFTGYEGDNRGIEFFINRSFYVPSCPGVEFRYRRGMDGQNSGIYVYRFDKSIKEIELTYLNLVDISEIPSDVKIFIPSSEIYYGIFVDRSCYAVGSPDIELREREYTDPDHWSGYGIFKYNGTASEIDLSSTSPLYYFGLCGIFPNAIPEGVKLLMSPDSLVLYSTEIEFYDVNNKDYKYQYDAFTGGLILKAYEGNSDELVIRSNVTGIDESAIPTSVTKVNLNDWNYTFYANCSAALSTGRFKFFAEMDSTFIQNLRNDWGASTIINLSTKRNPDILYRYENITGYDEFPIRLAGTDGSGSSVTLPGYYGAFTEEIISEYQNWLMQPHDGYYDNGEWHEIEVEPFNPFGKPIHVYPNTATANLLDSYGIPYNVRQTVKSSLPAAMTTIEEEAFMNSSFEEVTIGSKCTTIGARAFANSSELMIIHIPRNVRIIDDTAFEGCSQLKIYCKTGSVAETFASNHGIPYVNE